MSEKIEKMKSKNGGKLSYHDEGKIEKELNKVTVKIEKLKSVLQPGRFSTRKNFCLPGPPPPPKPPTTFNNSHRPCHSERLRFTA
jgi:hypothetical protein